MLLARAGTQVLPFLSGVLAGQGMISVSVFRRPSVTIISTGSELTEPGNPLQAAKIYSSNLWFLRSYLASLGFDAKDGGIVEDEPGKIAARIGTALSDSDLVVTTGGASVGDYDCTSDAYRLLGAESLFRKLRMKPGGAMLAAQKDGKLLLGLSGNPGEAALGLLRVASPYLRKLCGRTDLFFETIGVKLREPLRKESPKMRLLRGRLLIEEGEAWFICEGGQGGGDVSSLPYCDLLGEVPAGTPVPPGGSHNQSDRVS
jgi:molybdopterin molybdotransferase